MTYRYSISISVTLVTGRRLNITWVNNSWPENEMLFTILWWSKSCPSQVTTEIHMHVYICTTHTPKKWLATEPHFWLCCEWIFHGVSAALNEIRHSVAINMFLFSIWTLQCCNHIEILWDPTQTGEGNIYNNAVGAGSQCYYHRIKFHIWKNSVVVEIVNALWFR